MLKAYNTYPGNDPYDEGCILVFARNKNEARMIGYKKGPWLGNDYIDMTARRVPSFDECATGDIPYFEDTNKNLPKPFFDVQI